MKEHDVRDTVIASLATDDMVQNPEKYANIMPQKREKFVYHLRHGRVSPRGVDSRIEMLNELSRDVKKFHTQRRTTVADLQ